jgi:hypothetical protein
MASRARMGERAAVDSTTQRRDRSAAPRTPALARVAAHEHWIAAAAFALLALVYLWPALIGGRPLLPTAGLYQIAPWNTAAPRDLYDWFNPSLIDVPTSYYPWNVLARQLIRAGTFPAWNPYAFAGTPFFANPEVAWLSPFSLPLWILPLHYAFGLVAAIKLWLAGFGTYLLVRELRLGFWPALVAGLSFALCTFSVVWLTYGVHASVAVLLPWTIWLIERIVRRGRSVDGLALVAVVALVATGGHPGTQLHVLAGAALYALVRAMLVPDLARADRLRRLALVGAGLALGTLLAAATLLPAQQEAIDTAGAAARRDGSADFPGSRLSFAALRAILFPDWWGRPSEADLGGPGNYSERALFAGAIPAVLAAAALVARDDWRRKAPFALLGAIGLAVGLRAPLIRDAVVHAPLFDRVQNQRMLLWFLLGVALLSAFGLRAVLDGTPGWRRVWGASAAASPCAALALASFRTGPGAVSKSLHYVLHRSGELGAGVLPLASIGWFLIPAAALAALLLLAARRPGWRTGVGAAAALLVALEMLHFAHGFNPMGPPARTIPPRTPAIAYLQAHRAEGRIAGLGYALASDWTTVYGLRDARGYDAPQPSLRFHRLWRRMNPQQTTHNLYAFASLSPDALRLLSTLGTRYVIADPGLSVAVPGVRTVYRGGDATVLANRGAVPRVLAAARVHVAATEREEQEALLEPGFDPRRDVVVRRDELPPTFAAARPGGGSVRVLEERNARVVLRARLARPSVVLLDDAWAPGWSVSIDDTPVRALRADVVLRGVAVPAGEHEIVWSYRVPGLRVGAALSLLALAATLAWAAALAVRARRARRPPAPAG